MLIDTHCHLDFPEFDIDREEVIKRARESGVEYVINVGSSLENSRAAVKLSKEFSAVFASVGIHPHDAKNFTPEAFNEIKELAKNNDKVIAIGEVGLDFYRNLSGGDMQEEVFRQFIRLSKGLSLPLVVHSRQAQSNTLSILKEERFSSMRGVVHCFSGDKSFLRECLDLGFYISFTCNLTYKKADNLREIFKMVPPDRLLLETDAPYLSPEGFRGRRNEPAFVRNLAEFIAQLSGRALNAVAEATTDNARSIFSLRV